MSEGKADECKRDRIKSADDVKKLMLREYINQLIVHSHESSDHRKVNNLRFRNILNTTN